MPVVVAMLLHSELDTNLTETALAAQLRADFSLDLDATEPDERSDEPGSPIVLQRGDDMIALMPIGAPLGDDVPELAQHSRLWPDAGPDLSSYGAHTVVAVTSPDVADPEQIHVAGTAQMVLLTQVLASAVALTPGTVLAAYLGSANHLVLPGLLRDLALDLLPEPLPMVWVAFNVGARPDDGAMTGHTLGMDQLGLMDIEIAESPESAEDTFGRLTGIAGYLIANGNVIRDGDTLGESAEERITARHVPSVFDPSRAVLALDWSTTEQPARKGFLGRLRR